jgi:hypothetical protein
MSLRDWWNKLTSGQREAAVEHEAEREKMSPEERHFDDEKIQDLAADEAAEEHLGGFNPERLSQDDQPPTL